MKRVILATGLFVAIASATLHAQSLDMRANVPFNFRVGSIVLPSGEYSVKTLDNGMLFVHQLDGAHKAAFTFTIGQDRPKKSTAESAMEFRIYGETYYLSQVWAAGSQSARGLSLKPSREEEAARHRRPVQTAVIALAR